MKSKKNKKLAYGAEYSDRKYKLRLARYKALAEVVTNYVKEKNKSSVKLLDIGLGRGRTGEFIAQENAAKNIEFYGLDAEFRTNKKSLSSIDWQLFQGDIQKGTNFESEFFDIIICEQVLEHLEAPNQAMDEIERLLKRGGLLILGVPIYPRGISHLRRLYTSIATKKFGKDFSHIQTFDMGKTRSMINSFHNLILSDIYGVRILSGGIVSFLEDYYCWYKLNRKLGHLFPGLCTEIQAIVRKNP